jgi:hypothetical protein
MRLSLLCLTLAGALYAQDVPFSRPATLFPDAKPVPGRTLWRASVAALGAANAMDIQSSWKKHELNPLLATSSGQFGTQSALLKVGLQGGLVGIEYLITRKHPSGKLFRALAVINFGAAAGLGSAAAHNCTVPR